MKSKSQEFFELMRAREFDLLNDNGHWKDEFVEVMRAVVLQREGEGHTVSDTIQRDLENRLAGAAAAMLVWDDHLTIEELTSILMLVSGGQRNN